MVRNCGHIGNFLGAMPGRASFIGENWHRYAGVGHIQIFLWPVPWKFRKQGHERAIFFSMPGRGSLNGVIWEKACKFS